MSRKYAPNQIRVIRKGLGFTMEELSLRLQDAGLEITLATVHKLETCQMGLTLDYINAFAAALQVSPSDLISGAGGTMTRFVSLISVDDAPDWQKCTANSEVNLVVPHDAGGPRSFALKPEGDTVDKLVGKDGFIVVDPDQLDLAEGRCYAVRVEGIGVTFNKFAVNPPRFEPCSSDPQSKAISLGREPFTIIGRLTYIGSYI